MSEFQNTLTKFIEEVERNVLILQTRCHQLERELTAAKEENTRLTFLLELTRDEWKDGAAELALLRKRVEAADGLLKRINEDPAMSKRGGAGGQDQYAGMAPMHRHIDMYFAAYRATEGKK